MKHLTLEQRYHISALVKTKHSQGQIVGRMAIGERPAIVEEKQRVGDVEMDLVIGQGHSGVLLTINDRATGMLKMAVLESKGAAMVQATPVELLAGKRTCTRSRLTMARSSPTIRSWPNN